MILPIVAYGDPVLKRKADEIDSSYPDLQLLIDNMFETMYQAAGVGLAAPQIGKSIRLFVVDGSPFAEKEEDEEDDPLAEGIDGFKKVFINPVIMEETGEEWAFNEGCLSIPKIREDVYRKAKIRIQYFDENWQKHEEIFEGYKARIIQHEYDHIEGILFTDKLSPIRRKLISKKLANISKGIVSVDYKMKFPVAKKGR
ncbi:MAG: peptide deformylase [Flavobacteriia bacterium]|nr:peptide deformylase [Flavobacteriia bacterium]OJX34807.1 MAG: peptide deformylase [Flavobacteriia bacterium 40-80]